MSYSVDFINLAPPPNCINCNKTLSWSSFSQSGLNPIEKSSVRYSCNDCIVCLVESRTSIQYQLIPEVRIQHIDVSLNDLHLSIDYDRGITQLSKIEPYGDKYYGNKTMLDLTVIKSFSPAIKVNICPEDIKHLISTLASFS